MANYTKAIKRLLRQFNEIAYERQLRLALEQLDQHFAAWRAGQIDSFELTNRVHTFHSGVARDLYNNYVNRSLLDLNVAYAIATGIIARNEVPPELAAAIGTAIRHYTAMKEAGELRLPGE